MKTTIKLLAIIAILLTTFAHPSSASAHGYVFSYRGKSAYAYFSNVDGCIATEVFISVTDEIYQDPLFTQRSTYSYIDVFMMQNDLCTGSELMFASAPDGYVLLESSDFQVDSRLSTATLDATVTLFNYATSEYFDVDLDLTWTATGPLISQNSNSHYDFQRCQIESRKRGSDRLAEVSGTTTDGVTSFTLESSDAEISLVQDGKVFTNCH